MRWRVDNNSLIVNVIKSNRLDVIKGSNCCLTSTLHHFDNFVVVNS